MALVIDIYYDQSLIQPEKKPYDVTQYIKTKDYGVPGMKKGQHSSPEARQRMGHAPGSVEGQHDPKYVEMGKSGTKSITPNMHGPFQHREHAHAYAHGMGLGKKNVRSRPAGYTVER